MEQKRKLPTLEPEFDFFDYLRVIARRKWTAITICLSVLAMSALISFRTPRTYEANCTIKVYQQPPTVGLSEFYIGHDPFFLTTEIELIKSRTTIGKVVNRLGYSYDLKSVSKGLGKTVKLVEVAPNTKKNTLFIKFTDKEGNYRVVFGGKTVGYGTSGREFEGPFGKILIDAPRPKKGQSIEINIKDFDRETSKIISRMRVERIKEVNMINLTVRGSDPEATARIADTIADEYVKTSLFDKKLRVTSTVRFIEDQLLKTETELNDAEEDLKDFKRREGVIDLPVETRQQIETLARLESNLLEESIKQQVAKFELTLLRGRYGDVALLPAEDHVLREIDLAYFDESEKLTTLNRRILDLQEKRAEMLRTKTETHPDVKRLDQQLQELNDKYIRAVDEMMETGILATSVIVSDNKTANIGGIISDYREYLSRVPGKELELNRLTRRYQVNEKMYSLLLQELQEARIRESMETADIRVVDYAQVPKTPVSPNHTKNISLGLILGLLLGIGAVFILEFADTSITTAEGSEKVTNLPVIGIIPRFKENIALTHAGAKLSPGESIYFVAIEQPKSPISEAFRSLRTAVIASGVDEPISTLTVTSSGLSEGKTVIATNLAVVFAQMDAKTLLIDSDLRRSKIHRILNVAKEPGLSELLMGQAPRKNCLRETEVKNLFFIPSGIHPPNPSELLGSKKFLNLTDELNKEFQVIIFDTPPVLAVTDAVILAGITKGTLLVISAGKTDRFAAKRAIKLLERTRANILGVALNQVDVVRSYGSYGYKYYGQYYREYFEDETA